MRKRYLPVAVLAAAGLAACGDDLTVTNPNNPDVERALSTPEGIEAVFARSYQQVHNATHGTTNALWPQTQVVSGESYATVANFGMAARAGIPRQVIDNTRGNTSAAENNRDFSVLSRNARNILNGIQALDALVEADGSLGTASRDARARSFGFFTLGVAVGNLAMVYDSVAVPTMDLTSDAVPPLVGYQQASEYALAFLDSALAIANSPAAAGADFADIPNDWLRSTTATSRARYIEIVNSYKARFRAGVARTPAERTAVDWNKVVTEARAGINSDLVLALNNSLGWTGSFLNQALVAASWSQIPLLYLGFADTTASYANWLGSGDLTAARTPFGIRTPDTRFPQAPNSATGTAFRDALKASSPAEGTAAVDTMYFRVRDAGFDFPGEGWGTSWYDNVRFSDYRAGGSVGDWIAMDADELNMLEAEGLIRTNRDAQAVPLINESRIDHGLAPFPASADSATRAPAQPGGGPTSCVPRTPTGAGQAVECGTLWEAMKYEKRLETSFTGYAQWWIDGRGWGDLVQGTATQWPVPYQEMDARGGTFYNSQDAWRAAKGTYGF